MIRDALLGLFGIVWAVVVLIAAFRHGTVPAELWAVLGVGAGGLVAVFRTDAYVGRRRLDGNSSTDIQPKVEKVIEQPLNPPKD